MFGVMELIILVFNFKVFPNRLKYLNKKVYFHFKTCYTLNVL